MRERQPPILCLPDSDFSVNGLHVATFGFFLQLVCLNVATLSEPQLESVTEMGQFMSKSTHLCSQDAHTLAACQIVGMPFAQTLHNVVSGFLRARDSELLHAKLQSWTFYSESCGGSIRTCENPVGLREDRQDMSSFNLLEGRNSVFMPPDVGSFHL
jgi:hypothetical protein